MRLSFTNGDTEQQSGWQRAVEQLLNVSPSKLPVAVTVSFVDRINISGHGIDLAATTWSYGSATSITKVRNDAPDFASARDSLLAEAAGLGLPFNPAKFYTETAVHELGHSVFAALPHASRVAIAALFGAQTDSLSVLAPSGAEWADKIIEGIAETFKEAFLARANRAFPNRTNRRIPYRDFPRFRELIRQGLERSGLTFKGSDGVDANRSGGEDGTGLYSGELLETFNPNDTYVAEGRHTQQSEPGASVVARIYRLDAGIGVLDFYSWHPEMRMGWAVSSLGGPVTELALPPNAGKGYLSWTFDGAGGTVVGGVFHFNEPVYAYTGRFAELNLRFQFTVGTGGSISVLEDARWKTYAAKTVIEGLPSMMGVTATVPSDPGGEANYYLFSPVPLPVGSSEGRLELNPTLTARDSSTPPASLGEFETAVAALFEGQTMETPSGLLIPAGAAGGAKPHIRPVTGSFQ